MPHFHQAVLEKRNFYAEELMLSIGAVERDSGVGRDTLRIWERRYGYPVPLRTPKGGRLYSKKHVKTLPLLSSCWIMVCGPEKWMFCPTTS